MFIVMPKNTSKKKKLGTNVNLTTDSLLEIYYTISRKFKNLHFSTYCQNWLQTRKLQSNQTLFDRTYSNLKSFFLSKNIKVFRWLSKSKFSSFMTKMNPNNKNESKSDFFYEIYSNLIEIYSSQNNKIFHWLLEFSSLNFTTDLCTNK